MEEKALEGYEPCLHIFWKGVRKSACKALPKIGHLSEENITKELACLLTFI